MKLALVVTTLGRADPLRRLAESLRDQLTADDALVVVAQGNYADVEQALTPLHDGPASLTLLQSDRGASRGRNAGVAALPDSEDPLLLFPNDTTWFPPGVLDLVRQLPDSVRVAAATVADENGPKFTLPTPGTPLDRRSVWSVIEMGLLIRLTEFRRLGGFDESIGTGASTPWQAGEATDLLLRYDRDSAGDVVWLPPEVTFGGTGNSAGLTDAQRRRKLRSYGRGLGRLVARWRYPLWWQWAFIAAGLLVGVRHRSDFRVIDGMWGFLGRLEGVLGRTWGAGAPQAVDR